MSTASKLTERRPPSPVADLDGYIVLFPMKSDPFCDLPPSDTVKLELLNGEVIAMTRPGPRHQYFVLQLAMALERWARKHKLGAVFPDTLLKLNDEWTLAPDLMFVAQKSLRRVKEKRIEGPVDLAIEVLSPTTSEIDRATKFEAYARFGIRWYWIVDLDDRVLEEYQLVGDSYGKRVEVSFNKPFYPRLYPKLKVNLASLEL